MNHSSVISVRQLVLGAMTAALYVVSSWIFAPIAFGQVQVRISEALYAICLFSPMGVWGVTVGCLLTNLFFSPFGLIDVIVGTLSSFLASMAVYLLRKRPFIGYAFAVLFNAVGVGCVLSIMEHTPFLINALYIGAGEFIAIYAIGYAAYHLLNQHVFGGKHPLIRL